MKPGVRTIFYLAASLAVSASFLLDGQFTPENRLFWPALVGANLALWSSWPRYRSFLLQQATLTATLLLLANLVLSPLVWDPEPPVLAPDLRHHLVPDPEIFVGFEGVHTLTTDSRGHRTNRPIDYKAKPAGTLRVLAVGGSTTEEALLDDQKTWTSLLAARLSSALGRDVEMINTGVAGTRAEQHLLTLLASKAYAPDVAIFMMGINDWNRAIKVEHGSLLQKLQHLARPIWVSETLLFHAAVALQFRLKGLPPPPEKDAIFFDPGDFVPTQRNSLSRPRQLDYRPAAVDPRYASFVHRIMAECQRRRILCFFTDQPTAYDAAVPEDLKRRFWMTPPLETYTVTLDSLQHIARLYNDWMAATARAGGFPFCPLASDIPPTTDYFFDDCHFNENGAAKVASLVAACLLQDRKALVQRSAPTAAK